MVRTLYVIGALLSAVVVGTAMGQGPVHQRTVIVDKNGEPDANFTKIQDAITDIEVGEGEQWTVLIYAGEYPENITLDTDDDHIDLVGVDPEGVIINPPTGVGITISGSGDRNNNIANLTVKPTAGDGIILGQACSLTNVTVDAQDDGKDAVQADGKSDIQIINCTLTGKNAGLTLTNDCTNVIVRGCSISGDAYGAYITCGDDILFQGNTITSSSTGNARGVFIDDAGGCDIGNVTFLACQIKTTSRGVNARAVELPRSEKVELVACDVIGDTVYRPPRSQRVADAPTAPSKDISPSASDTESPASKKTKP